MYKSYFKTNFGLSIISALFAFNVNAEVVTANQTPFTLSGEVALVTCGLASSERIKEVVFGTVSVKDLSGAIPTSRAEPIHFDLADCPPDSIIGISIEGPKDPKDQELLAIDQSSATPAKNVAIELLDANMQRSEIGKRHEFLTDSVGRVSTVFYARYILTGSPIESGSANATATIKLDYQ